MHRDGWFALRLRCPGSAPETCRGKVVVSRGGDRLAGTKFRLDRGAKGDVSLRLNRDGRKALERRGRLHVLVRLTSGDRSASARVMLVGGHAKSHVSQRLSRGQARRLVAKYRVIAETWSR